jgi:PTS system nitrogen regulatory IIA component
MHLRLPEDVDRSHLLRVLVARERLASTGVGDGIAIPHPRNPLLLSIHRPTVALCFLEHPVDWAALDGRPVKILFPVVTPTLRTHLRLLSTLGFVLRDRTFRALLAEEGSRESLLRAVRQVESELGKEDPWA